MLVADSSLFHCEHGSFQSCSTVSSELYDKVPSWSSRPVHDMRIEWPCSPNNSTRIAQSCCMSKWATTDGPLYRFLWQLRQHRVGLICKRLVQLAGDLSSRPYLIENCWRRDMISKQSSSLVCFSRMEKDNGSWDLSQQVSGASVDGHDSLYFSRKRDWQTSDGLQGHHPLQYRHYSDKDDAVLL